MLWFASPLLTNVLVARQREIAPRIGIGSSRVSRLPLPAIIAMIVKVTARLSIVDGPSHLVAKSGYRSAIAAPQHENRTEPTIL
jgi:hypothetical protein